MSRDKIDEIASGLGSILERQLAERHWPAERASLLAQLATAETELARLRAMQADYERVRDCICWGVDCVHWAKALDACHAADVAREAALRELALLREDATDVHAVSLGIALARYTEALRRQDPAERNARFHPSKRAVAGGSLVDAWSHARWMIDQIPAMVDGNPAKAMRWLCFLQGVLWTCSLLSINDARLDNYRILNGGKTPDEHS